MSDFGIIFIVFLAMLLIYLIGGGLLEHYHVKVIHETGLGIITGIIVGFIIYQVNYDFYHKHMLFEGELFFYFILPPIIFAGGYNLKKRRFFENFYYINLYGLAGTILNFITVWLLTYIINQQGLIRRFSDFGTSVTLSNRSILLFSATICATDSVSALAMIKPDSAPKLFSVIFGEGMVNDSVSIILYKSMLDLVGEEEEPKAIDFSAITLLEMFGQFLKNSLLSLLIGLFYGAVASLATKRLRFLAHNPVVETVVVLLLGFSSFATSEILELSGVISILVTGICMSHYLFYNISSTGKVSTGLTFGSISTIAEAGLYIYLGIIVWQTKGEPRESSSYAWSWSFLILELFVVFFARTVSVFVPSWIGMLIKGRNNWRLNRYEMGIVWFSGIIRGAVAFALIMNVPGDKHSQEVQIVQSTTLFIVIITTVVLGGIMPNYIAFMQRQIENNPRYPIDHPSMMEVKLRLLNESDKEQFQKEKRRSPSYVKWLWFDETILKPFLIFDYENRKDEIHRDRTKLKLGSAHFDAESYLKYNKDELQEQSPSTQDQVFQVTIENTPMSPNIFQNKSIRKLNTDLSNLSLTSPSSSPKQSFQKLRSQNDLSQKSLNELQLNIDAQKQQNQLLLQLQQIQLFQSKQLQELQLQQQQQQQQKQQSAFIQQKLQQIPFQEQQQQQQFQQIQDLPKQQYKGDQQGESLQQQQNTRVEPNFSNSSSRTQGNKLNLLQQLHKQKLEQQMNIQEQFQRDQELQQYSFQHTKQGIKQPIYPNQE